MMTHNGAVSFGKNPPRSPAGGSSALLQKRKNGPEARDKRTVTGPRGPELGSLAAVPRPQEVTEMDRRSEMV